MTLSISNFKVSPLVQSVLVFSVLFVGYNVVLQVTNPRGGYFQNQWEKKLTTAEDYIFEEKREVDVVIVGSSLTAGLDEGNLGPRFQNLSLVGKSAVTGLEIIRRCRSRVLPKVVLVETNILRDPDTDFVEARFDPLAVFVKRHIPSARAKYHPVNLLLSAIKVRDEREEVVTEAKVFAYMLADMKRDYSIPDNPARVRTALAAVAKEVEALKADGVKVVFFRMPLDPSIESSPKARGIKEAYRREFPPPKFAWLEVAPGDYQTRDGIHLAPQSARDFSGKIRRALEVAGY